MHARDLVELAALVAVNSPLIVRGAGEVPQSASEQYWAASKCRLDRWLRLLKQLHLAAEQPPTPATLAWARVYPALEELLASELLTRIWTATAAAYDLARGDQNLEPVARNIMSGHLEARRRLLALLAGGRAIEEARAAHLNRVRCRVERWGDMLLAHLAEAIDIEAFAFEPERAREFAHDLDREAAQAERQFTSQLVLASLRGAFATGLAERSPNVDLNRRIGSAILASFHGELSDGAGLVKSLWLERITQTANDTENMIEELLLMETSGHERVASHDRPALRQ